MTLHIRPSTDNQFYWTLNSRNGKVLATSETYKTVQAVLKTVNKVASQWPTLTIKNHVK